MSFFFNIIIPYILFPMLGLFLSAFFTSLAIKVLPKFNMVDIPRGRHKHDNTVPRGGGIAIIIAFFTIILLLLLFSYFTNNRIYQDLEQLLCNFSAPATIMLIVGLLDDRFELRSFVKLFFQIIVGVMFYIEGCGISLLFNYELPQLVSLLVTVIWCVTIINAFNLIDGLDGLAAGLGAISSFLLAIWSFISGYKESNMLILLCFAVSNLGFLRYNFSPAKIFMGDTGSMFIGLFFAYVSMQYSTKSVTFTALTVPLAAVGIPIFDVFLAVWRRAWRKYINKDTSNNIMQGDHDHLHHRILKETGKSGKTALIIYGLSITFSLLAMISEFLQTSFPTLAFILVLVAIFAMIRYSNIELYDTLTSVAKGVDLPHRNFLLIAIHPIVDSLLILFSVYLSNQFYGTLLPFVMNGWWYLLFMAPFVIILCFSGIYRTFWLKAGILQYYKLIRLLIICGVSGYVVNCFLLHYLICINSKALFAASSYYLVFWFMGSGFIVAERFILHYYESFGYRKLFIRNQGKYSTMPKILIYGGGLSCRMYISGLYCNFGKGVETAKIIGIMDDNSALRNLNIYGFKVLGGLTEIESIFKYQKFDRIVLTNEEVACENIEKLKNFCTEKNIELRKFIYKEIKM